MRIAIALLLGAACVADPGAAEEGGSTAPATSESGGSSTTGDPYGGQCDEIPTVLADAQQVGLTGVSAGDVLAQVEGVYTGTIAWSAATPAHYVGSTEPSPLTLEIRYDGGEIRSVDAVLVHPCMHNGPCPCDDSLEIDVTWRLASADGVLDETWNAPLVHQPGSWFMGSDVGISQDFQPDDTNGSLAASSFDLDEGFVLQRLVAQAELVDGAAQGSISTEIEMLGGIGYGPAAGFSAVIDVGDLACNALAGEPACGWAGCTPVTGQRVYGVPPGCGCNDPEPFCFAAPLAGDPTLTLYTRTVSEGIDAFDEVVAFSTLADPPPPPWRACVEAPEVPECACVDPC